MRMSMESETLVMRFNEMSGNEDGLLFSFFC